MDHDEAIRLLRSGPKGVKKWNRRREARELIPSLSRADLSNADLRVADLNNADLSGANLSKAVLYRAEFFESVLNNADIHGANLSRADLGVADLRDANLSRANFGGAELRKANLSRADLSGADFSIAVLEDTDLSGANLSYAVFVDTVIANVDLSVAKGLDSIEHLGPSYLSTDTLIRSRGKIPESFLRGCGVPDALIAYLPSLIGALSPIQFYSCFISYSAKDTPFAERLHVDLQAKGVRCWYAPEDLKIGERIRVGIDESIRLHDKLLLVLSKHSVASDWVEQEVETAMEQERRQKRTVLFPIRLDDAVVNVDSGWPAHIKRTRNVGDFKRWRDHDAYQKAFARLLRDLQAVESVGQS